MILKREKTYEAKIYLGSKEAYKGKEFTLEDLTKFIGSFQKDKDKDACPLRIAECHYMFEDYIEKGWEVVVINYPRFPKPESKLFEFMSDLAKALLMQFKQNRISLVTPTQTYMYSSEEAKQTHDED